MADRTPEEHDRHAGGLLAEMIENERYADELAGYATNLRLAGHEDAADRLLSFSRRCRIMALDLRGRLAAVFASRDSL